MLRHLCIVPKVVTTRRDQDATTGLQAPSDLFTTYTRKWLKDERISARGTYQAAHSPPHSAPSQPHNRPLHAANQRHNQRRTNNRNNSNHGDTPDNTKLQRRTQSPAVHRNLRNTVTQLPGADPLARSSTAPHCVATPQTDYQGTLAPVAGRNNSLFLFAKPPPPQGPTQSPTPCKTTGSDCQPSTATTSRKTTDSVSPQWGDVATQP